MGLKESTKIRIKKYILEKIEYSDKKLANKVAENFDISLTTVYRYIKELEQNGIIEKKDRKYELVETEHVFYYKINSDNVLEEDEIFTKAIHPYISKLPMNIYKIWKYSFTEMMNNAIEHSESNEIYGHIVVNYLNTSIVIIDEGIGIFEKIRAYYKYDSIDDAVTELFKGKLTTDAAKHSGEGIFFTSRMLDRFAALSGGKIFTHDLHRDYYEDLDNIDCMRKWKSDKGTKILMSISNFSEREIKEVFGMFSDPDEGFNKTQIPIKNIFPDGYPVSRSQARRLCFRFEDFREVILDFKGVDDIGQGFAHEVFVVFHKKHPNVKILVMNAGEDVINMIKHVERTDKLRRDND